MWSEHVEQYLEHARDGESLLVRFEDVIRGGGALSEISEHIGAEVQAAVLDEKVSGASADRADSTTFVERAVLRRHVEACAEVLGYEAV